MTESDQNALIGEKVRQYSDNAKRISCLRIRLEGVREDIRRALEYAPDEDGRGAHVMIGAQSVQNDVHNLQVMMDTQARLREFFREQGLSGLLSESEMGRRNGQRSR